MKKGIRSAISPVIHVSLCRNHVSMQAAWHGSEQVPHETPWSYLLFKSRQQRASLLTTEAVGGNNSS
jgi:hypothetical protein